MMRQDLRDHAAARTPRRPSPLGAPALGFVFWPDSPRFIEPARARAIVDALPPFVTDGRRVRRPAGRGARDVPWTSVGLGAVQLHGDEAAGPTCAASTGAVIKAVALGSPDADGADWRSGRRTTLLLDAHDPVRRGGTGRIVDWDRRRRLRATPTTSSSPGGLTPENVAEAVASRPAVRHRCVVGRGAAPGIKDLVKLAALFDALRAWRCEP